MPEERAPLSRLRLLPLRLVQFTAIQLACCAFPIAFILALWGSVAHFTVGGDRYRMPTAVSFVLIGVFLWLAENIGTFLNAWRYPDQQAGWHLVHVGKLGSWALLVTLSFVLVAAVKAEEGVRYGDGEARVTPPRRRRRAR
ncbi:MULTISPECIES: DUF817 family protein [unclassified Actinomyces]|uniref:DUF817 family protein n=1 Tax=unclassified Actinomyces TaxID=2609248 RepID=UPI000D58ECEE|nr:MULTISPECIES: DUF817 family protein [unclassified Actinomyces]RAX23078.1 DUF817 family protein [Actinomyces sp. Z3]